VELIEENKQDELDKKTQAILLKFKLLLEKQNLPPIKGGIDGDLAYLKFLRARKHDINAAKDMYEKAIEYRKQYNADEILERNKEVYETMCPGTFHKCDKEGRPCYFERSGMIRVPKVLEYVTEDDCVDQHVWYMEQVCQQIRESQKRGNKVSTFIYVMDLKGLSMWPDPVAIRIFRKTLSMDQNFYPETLGRCVMLNAPQLFGSLWNMIKSWLDPVTASKFVIIGSGEIIPNTFLKWMNKEDIPKEYGGTCDCKPCIPPQTVPKSPKIVERKKLEPQAKQKQKQQQQPQVEQGKQLEQPRQEQVQETT